ncbi:DUF2306 domain-containing protein [Primorskyibacter sp. S187A]|uniref:DUF2306 domain-containing protein n=1 Tax=Primorskyibacter sp. S187A TaxID=3415130 RepID=UPI003C7D3959
MSFEPFLTEPLHIQIHAVAACLSILLGPVALYARKGSPVHKSAGYLWVTSMSVTGISAFFISGFAVIGPFSPLHLLAISLLWGIVEAMRHVFAGRVALHARIMNNLYWFGVVLASAFNFLPGRMVNRMVFDDLREAGFVVLALILFGVVLREIVSRRGPADRRRTGARA